MSVWCYRLGPELLQNGRQQHQIWLLIAMRMNRAAPGRYFSLQTPEVWRTHLALRLPRGPILGKKQLTSNRYPAHTAINDVMRVTKLRVHCLYVKIMKSFGAQFGMFCLSMIKQKVCSRS